MECKHIVGIVYYHELTDLIGFEEIKEYEKSAETNMGIGVKRFCFCPLCGDKIDWESFENQ